MSLLFVIIVVIVLGLLASFAPIDANFKRLLWYLAAGVVVLWLVLLLLGLVDLSWPHRTVVVP